MLKLRALAVGVVTVGLLQFALATVALAGEGYASWYGEPYHGRMMASGQVFDMHDPTITASNEFPFGTWLRVTNPSNGNWVDVQVRDRGGFRWPLDLSYAAFARLAPPSAGMVWVHYEVIPGPGEPPAGEPAPGPEPAASEPTHDPAASEPAGEPSPEPGPEPEAAGPAPEPSQPTAAPEESGAPPPSPVSHSVAPGETLASIAWRFELRTLDVAAWNDLDDPNLLRPGQVLRLEPPAEPADAGPVPVGALFPAEAYVVEAGDVLWRIAERLEVDPHALARANNLGADATLRVGQRLAVPSEAVYHRVEPGETLSMIARHFETSVDTLVYMNELDDPNHLAVGQSLRVR